MHALLLLSLALMSAVSNSSCTLGPGLIVIIEGAGAVLALLVEVA